MKSQRFIGILLAAVAVSFASCHDEDKPAPETGAVKPALKEENITYTGDGVTMQGYVVYDSSKTDKRPAVLVVHEWWGLNDYSKRRARELAELGYIAMALDMYGNGKTADNPDSAGKYSGYFYSHVDAAKNRFDAALAKLKSYNQADGSKVGAIGYCFGGAIVLGMARLGDSLAGVVSFHGGGLNAVPPVKDLLKAKVLVCQGGDDSFVPQPEVDKFKKQMDSIGASYTLKVYPGGKHAFTNPDATALGEKFKIPIAYNPAADTASWKDMKEFFGTVFK
jgi:dienelactone hydrolase